MLIDRSRGISRLALHFVKRAGYPFSEKLCTRNLEHLQESTSCRPIKSDAHVFAKLRRKLVLNCYFIFSCELILTTSPKYRSPSTGIKLFRRNSLLN